MEPTLRNAVSSYFSTTRLYAPWAEHGKATSADVYFISTELGWQDTWDRTLHPVQLKTSVGEVLIGS